MNTISLCAVCSFGLESILKREIIRLGFPVKKVENGKVYYSGDDIHAVALSNLYLRTADRVFLKIGEFDADSFDSLYEGILQIPFEEYVPADGRFDIYKINSVRSKLYSKSDCQAIVKKAVAQRLQKMHRVRLLPETGAAYPIAVHIANDHAEVFLNTSGAGLNRRGYRQAGNEAPLKETLAAAMVLLSNYRAEKTLADVMCGSGTILIEAAMIMKNIAPGIRRNFASEYWSPQYTESYVQCREAAHKAVKEVPLRILGSDIDYFSIKQAKENAHLAGVENDIAFQKLDLKDFSSKKKCGVIISNAPYGMRTGGSQVQTIYENLGRIYRNLNEWSAFILSGYDHFENAFGQKCVKNRKLYNGGIKTYLYSYYPQKENIHGHS